MNILTPPRTLMLSFCLLLGHAAFGSINAGLPLSPFVKISGIEDVLLASTFVMAASDQPAVPSSSSAKDNSAAKDNSQLMPDSYLGTVVSLMFLAGIVVLLARWPRRRRRREIVRFERPEAKKLKRRAS